MRNLLLGLLLLLPAGCHRCPVPPCSPDLASPDLSAPADLASPADLSAPDLSPPDQCLACNALINPCNALGLHCYRGCCSADPH